MTAVPVTRTYVAGEVLLASYPNTNINGPLNFLLNPPIFQGRQTAIQSLTNATSTAILQDAEDVDSANGHSNITNTSRYTAVYPGWYRIGGGVSYATNATGFRAVEWFINGVVINAGGVLVSAVTGNTTRLPARSMLVFLNVNDYIEIFGYQTSGGALNTSATVQEQSSTSLNWISN